MTRTPHRFTGVAKIIRFNAQFYLFSIVALALGFLLLQTMKLPRWLEGLVLCGLAVAAFWTIGSLFVSWYVYDYAGITRWKWLPGRIEASPKRWVNIHVGLDEPTTALRKIFAGSEGMAVDIYSPQEMTEPSIARARRIYPSTEPSLSARYDALPLPADSQDAVFLLFAAHEVREAMHRTRLLRECARVVRSEGSIVVAEHLRDWRNFLAFGPGFLHFHSRRNWLNTFRNAGLVIRQESFATPFTKCFVLRRSNQ